MLLPLLTIFDFSTVRANFIKPLNLNAVKSRSSDFAILIPIFNDIKYLRNIAFLKEYASHVVLCTTTNETPQFMSDIQKISKMYGFRVHTSNVGDWGKNPWAIFNKTLLAHDAVLKITIGSLKEKYVIFIDGDTYAEDDIAILIGAMEENNFDISSVKVLPSERHTVIQKLQGIEYDIAMQARLIYPWLTSGAGMVAKRDVMISIMKNHSLFFNGGDVEIGKLADMMGYKVGHIPMIFYTDVPGTFKTWVKQRFSWMCGMFRHSIINFDQNFKHPFHFIYFTFIIYFLLPFKVYEMITKPYLIPFILSMYVVVTYFSNWKVRNRWMVLFPFYALFQVLVIVWFGMYRYFKTVITSKNIGRIRMKYNPNGVSIFQPKRALATARNYLVIFGVVLLILSTNVSLFQEIAFGREYRPLELASIIAKEVEGEVEKVGGNVAMAPSYIKESVAGASTEVLENYDEQSTGQQ